MKAVFRYLLLAVLVILSAQPSWAAEPIPLSDTCPVSLDLNPEEHDAYIEFHARLSHLLNYYGHDSFASKLNEIITTQWPEKKVIEISPIFMEKVLNLVDQQYLKDSIARTIGLNHPAWQEFERVMKRVTLMTYTTENKYGAFTKKTEALIKAIETVPRKYMKPQVYSAEQAGVLKARAISRIANMTVFLARWDIINREITKQRGEAAGKQLLLNTVSVAAGGLLIASIVYSGAIVAGAGTFAASFASDAVVAAQLARLGQVVGGMGMGVVGAPTTVLLTDSTNAVLEAQRQAADNHSVYACELDQQMKEWKARGVSPYLNAALVGGSVGAVGVVTFTTLGAQTILYSTALSVGIAEAYMLGQINDYGMKSLAEYNMAIKAHERGDDEEARAHLRKSREYAQAGGQSVIQALVVGALSISIASEFGPALRDGEAAIRVMFANSSDTLPTALGIAMDSVRQTLKF
jgi:hypothetical protein